MKRAWVAASSSIARDTRNVHVDGAVERGSVVGAPRDHVGEVFARQNARRAVHRQKQVELLAVSVFPRPRSGRCGCLDRSPGARSENVRGGVAVLPRRSTTRMRRERARLEGLGDVIRGPISRPRLSIDAARGQHDDGTLARRSGVQRGKIEAVRVRSIISSSTRSNRALISLEPDAPSAHGDVKLISRDSQRS